MRLYIREERIKKEGSPYYSIILPVLAAGGNTQYSIEKSTELVGADRFAPLDWVEIGNNDSVDIEVEWSGLKMIIFAGTIREISGKWYDRFRITNLSATTATTLGSIRIACRRQPITLDRIARKLNL
jgi:hypothetical protein